MDANVLITITSNPIAGVDAFVVLTNPDIAVVNSDRLISWPSSERDTSFTFEVGSTITQTRDNLIIALKADYEIFGTDITVEAFDTNGIFIYRSTSGSYFESGSGSWFTANASDPPDEEFDFWVSSYGIAGATPCDNFRLNFNTKNAAYPIVLSGFVTKTINDASELNTDVPRYTYPNSRSITVTDDAANVIQISMPDVKPINIYSVAINYSLSGATAQILVSSSGPPGSITPTPYNYSLNGTTWQGHNSFPGLEQGEYTAYAMDVYGCIKTRAFSVSVMTDPRPAPYLEISRANPLRFVEIKDHEFKTINNTLMEALPMPNIQKRFFKQPFRLGDSITTQIRSSYRDLTLNIYDCDDLISDTFIPNKIIQNIGLKDKRDCVVLPGAGGLANISLQGNIYDVETNEVTGVFYPSNGRLPNFAEAGISVEILSPVLSGTFEIIGVEFNTNIQMWVMVIDTVITSAGVGTCYSIYNDAPYDIYQISFNITSGQYYAKLEATDADVQYDDQTWQSEPFYISDKHDDILAVLDYTSTGNQEAIDFRANVLFRLVIPARILKYTPAGEDETFEDDMGTKRILKSINIRQLELETHTIPMWLAEKIVIASTHNNLYINGQKMVVNDKPDVDNYIDENNPFYVVRAIFDEDKQIVITDRSGVVTTFRTVLGTGENVVIGA